MSSNENARELSMNPQKKRLEQLRKRREYAEMVEKQQMAANSKTKKKASREPVKASRENVEQETNVKMSAENVDYEYSVEEDYEDDEYRATKNETIKKLLMHKFKLEKSLKLSRENEKKLNAMLESSGKWFDKYEKTLEELEDQVTIYDQKRKIVVDNLIENVHPLCDRWRAAQKAMAEVKISVTGPIHSASLFGNLLHYGISILRQVLFYMAYCRDLFPRLHAQPVMSTPPGSDSPRTLNVNSLRLSVSVDKK